MLAQPGHLAYATSNAVWAGWKFLWGKRIFPPLSRVKPVLSLHGSWICASYIVGEVVLLLVLGMSLLLFRLQNMTSREPTDTARSLWYLLFGCLMYDFQWYNSLIGKCLATSLMYSISRSGVAPSLRMLSKNINLIVLVVSFSVDGDLFFPLFLFYTVPGPGKELAGKQVPLWSQSAGLSHLVLLLFLGAVAQDMVIMLTLFCCQQGLCIGLGY